MLVRLYRCFTEGDCDLAEINPLILRPDGGVHALDAKVSLDNNAAFRHPEWDEFRATEELDEREQLARKHDLQYIGLEGSVGIIANGAGLAMCTLDVVNQVGGTGRQLPRHRRRRQRRRDGGGARGDQLRPEREVRSSSTSSAASPAARRSPRGSSRRCGRVELRAPIVIRLDGTNAEQGREILANAGIPESKLTSEPTMLEAARAAVAIANGEQLRWRSSSTPTPR